MADNTAIPLDIVLLGPLGAGKGTQAKFISEEFGLPHVATGDLLRAHRVRGTDLGRQAQAFMDSGALVPDDVVITMVRDRVSQPDAADGVLLDGFPRTVAQAEALDGQFQQMGRSIRHVLYLDVPSDKLVQRLSGRWTCRRCQATYHESNNPPRTAGVCDACGGELYQREDDKPDVVTARLKTYLENTVPVVEYYRRQGKLREINGNQEIAAVTAISRAVIRGR